MTVSSLCHHMERSHRIVLTQIRGVDFGVVGTQTYRVLFPQIFNSVECPVEGCPERANTPVRLREHFVYQHCKSKVDIMQEVPELLPRCDQCGMHMPVLVNIRK